MDKNSQTKEEKGFETKETKLSDLRKEIDNLEQEITERKRKELIMTQERFKLETYYSWKAPERPFNPKDKRWYINAFGISLIITILAVLTGTYLLIIAVIAVLVLYYIMSTVPPQIFTYTITNKGVRFGNKMYLWRQIPSFWITERGSDVFINFGNGDNPEFGRLTILSGEGDINIIAKELVRYIDYLSPQEIGSNIITNITDGRPKEINELIGENKNSENKESQASAQPKVKPN
ncbi:MAG TPA: hypothetical protein VGA67_02710 [Candidatus Dojkabacteria bacterium]|jgi:hypothetical protein